MDEDSGPTPFSLNLNVDNPEQDALLWSISEKPAKGVANISSTGSVTYMPEANYYGTDFFTVQVRSGDFTDTVKVTVIINPVNDYPYAVELNNKEISENMPSDLVGMLSVKDADMNDTHIFSLVSGTGDDDNGFFILNDNRFDNSLVFDYETKNLFKIPRFRLMT